MTTATASNWPNALTRDKSEIGAPATHAALRFLAPGDPGNVENITGAGVLRSSRHQAAAQAFLAFLTSTQGQEILAHSDSFEYPIHPGVAANPQLPPLSGMHPNGFGVAELGTGEDARALLLQAQLI